MNFSLQTSTPIREKSRTDEKLPGADCASPRQFFQYDLFQFARSVCTVLLLIPNFLAAARTVALFSMMYTAKSQARSSMLAFKNITPSSFYPCRFPMTESLCNLYAAGVFDMLRDGSWYVMGSDRHPIQMLADNGGLFPLRMCRCRGENEKESA
jgi:hypothetical protein